MRFTISREKLQEGLAAVGASIPAKTTLPVLANILVETTEKGSTKNTKDHKEHKDKEHKEHKDKDHHDSMGVRVMESTDDMPDLERMDGEGMPFITEEERPAVGESAVRRDDDGE